MPTFIYHDVPVNSNDHVNFYTGLTGTGIEQSIQESNQSFSWYWDQNLLMFLSGNGNLQLESNISSPAATFSNLTTSSITNAGETMVFGRNYRQATNSNQESSSDNTTYSSYLEIDSAFEAGNYIINSTLEMQSSTGSSSNTFGEVSMILNGSEVSNACTYLPVENVWSCHQSSALVAISSSASNNALSVQFKPADTTNNDVTITIRKGNVTMWRVQ